MLYSQTARPNTIVANSTMKSATAMIANSTTTTPASLRTDGRPGWLRGFIDRLLRPEFGRARQTHRRGDAGVAHYCRECFPGGHGDENQQRPRTACRARGGGGRRAITPTRLRGRLHAR